MIGFKLRQRVWLTGILTAAAAVGVGTMSAQADWNRFRGPNGSGVAESESVTKTSFDASNLLWSVELSGAGVSSPIIVGDKVILTVYSGYGEPSRDGSIADLVRSIYCFEAESGRELWHRDVPAAQPEDTYDGMGIPSHGYASHTPVSDGENVYAFFGKSGVYAWDLNGNQLWNKTVGSQSDPRKWGSSSSPIMVDDLIVVTAGPESRAIVALDKRTGEEAWRAASDSFGDVWGTPATVSKTGQTSQVIIGAPYEIWSIDAQTGKLRWYAEAVESDQFNSSVIVGNETVYAIEGRGAGAIAIKATGKGDVTKDSILWTGNQSGRFATPLLYDGRIYSISGGIASCIDAATGKEVFQGRLPAPPAAGGSGGGRGRGTDYSSPIAADGKIFYITNAGVLHVIAAKSELESLGVSQIGSDESFAATPAIDGGSIYIRSNKKLYKYSLR